MPYKNTTSKEAKESQSRRNKLYYEKNKSKVVEINIPEKKQCSVCKETKAWTEFYPRKNRPNGLTAWCKVCLKEHADRYKEEAKKTRRYRDFGINRNEYDKLYSEQDGLCAICKRPESDIQQNSLCVDHDHDTGRIRGLLCHDCNVGLGRFKDNTESLKMAIEYLNN